MFYPRSQSQCQIAKQKTPRGVAPARATRGVHPIDGSPHLFSSTLPRDSASREAGSRFTIPHNCGKHCPLRHPGSKESNCGFVQLRPDVLHDRESDKGPQERAEKVGSQAARYVSEMVDQVSRSLILAFSLTIRKLPSSSHPVGKSAGIAENRGDALLVIVWIRPVRLGFANAGMPPPLDRSVASFPNRRV